nr:LOW QUALITY PROTEIN: SWI/SNF-related matrix-associated actin-dependent regulator of chromatin subfamily D member 2-like [Globicephala melas]
MCEHLGSGDEVAVTGGEFFQICIGGKGALKRKSLEERRAWPKEPGNSQEKPGKALEETVILDTDGGHYKADVAPTYEVNRQRSDTQQVKTAEGRAALFRRQRQQLQNPDQLMVSQCAAGLNIPKSHSKQPAAVSSDSLTNLGASSCRFSWPAGELIWITKTSGLLKDLVSVGHRGPCEETWHPALQTRVLVHKQLRRHLGSEGHRAEAPRTTQQVKMAAAARLQRLCTRHHTQDQPPMPAQRRGLKRRKVADKVLPQRTWEPEPQVCMDLLAFERKLDQTIARKRMEIQEAIKKPLTQKRKLRIYISNMFSPSKAEGDSAGTAGSPGGNPAGDKVASWELRVEGKLLDDLRKQKRKFSSFFKSLVIELDKELYGPDNHLLEWHRMPTTQETDGFQVKPPGDLNVKCTCLLVLAHQPPQYKSDPRLGRLLGVHTQTRAAVTQALRLYIKHNQLQDGHEWEYVNCNRYFRQIFSCGRLRFSEIPMKLARLPQHPDPIVVNHVISLDPNNQKKTGCYDIDVEVDDPLKAQMSNFLASTTNQQEIASLDVKIHETIESINQLKTQKDLMLSFRTDPQDFIQEWLRSQHWDLKIITDVIGNPEEERQAAFYQKPWAQEPVGRHIIAKVQQQRQELEQVLGTHLI